MGLPVRLSNYSWFQSSHPPSVIPRYFSGPTLTKEKKIEYKFSPSQAPFLVKYSATHGNQLIPAGSSQDRLALHTTIKEALHGLSY